MHDPSLQVKALELQVVRSKSVATFPPHYNKNIKHNFTGYYQILYFYDDYHMFETLPWLQRIGKNIFFVITLQKEMSQVKNETSDR